MNNSFTTKQDAINWLEANGFEWMDNGSFYRPGTYYLRHGEYERPDYTPRRYKDGWGIHAKHYYFSGTLYAPEDGRVSLDHIAPQDTTTKKQLKILTVTLAIETESEDMDAIEAAVCSNLADLSIDYDCEDDDLESDGVIRVVVEGRIAIASTEHCKVDSGASSEFQHPGAGAKSREFEGRTFLYG